LGNAGDDILEKYAPVVLFVYARPEHTKRTLNALANNIGASETDLIIFSDGAKKESDIDAVLQVRQISKSAHGFKSVKLVERNSNFGLAKNIIEGLNDISAQFHRFIVMEDDLETAPQFLTFMNSALRRYESNTKIWHISGWNYPIDVSGLGDAIILRVMNCWGWGSWSDRWKKFEKDTGRLISEFDDEMIRNFDLDNSGDFWSQVLQNERGEINTWAIYWYATIFKNNGLCLNPAISLVKNIGLDGSGTHGSTQQEQYGSRDVNARSHFDFPNEIEESRLGISRIIKFNKKYKKNILLRVLIKIHSIIFKK